MGAIEQPPANPGAMRHRTSCLTNSKTDLLTFCHVSLECGGRVEPTRPRLVTVLTKEPAPKLRLPSFPSLPPVPLLEARPRGLASPLTGPCECPRHVDHAMVSGLLNKKTPGR